MEEVVAQTLVCLGCVFLHVFLCKWLAGPLFVQKGVSAREAAKRKFKLKEVEAFCECVGTFRSVCGACPGMVGEGLGMMSFTLAVESVFRGSAVGVVEALAFIFCDFFDFEGFAGLDLDRDGYIRREA